MKKEAEMKVLNKNQYLDSDELKTLKATLKTGDLLVCDDLQHN